MSSTLRWHAVLENDAEANAESGFPELIRYLRNGCSARPTGWPAAAWCTTCSR